MDGQLTLYRVPIKYGDEALQREGYRKKVAGSRYNIALKVFIRRR
ncbi:protein of unknown function [Nitrospira japonica]|uniref:Uncharacterized protein n=1 Tax=Nitrospira japonica TaxID=1325564 RepID=A0A1W1I8G0_9BACT|nr:protein of unknown function [Nitrospira japonica]